MTCVYLEDHFSCKDATNIFLDLLSLEKIYLVCDVQEINQVNCVKYRNFTKFPDMEIFWRYYVHDVTSHIIIMMSWFTDIIFIDIIYNSEFINIKFLILLNLIIGALILPSLSESNNNNFILNQKKYSLKTFIIDKMTLWHERSLVKLLHSFRTSFPKNSSKWLLLIL